jgi:hypothetical protein
VAVQDRLVDEILGDHRLAEPLCADEDETLGVGEKVEGEDTLDEGPVDLLGPVPLEIGDGLEAAQPGALEAALQAAPGAVLEFGGRERFEERDGRPAVFGRAREQIVEVVGDAGEAQATQVITQGRWRGRG